MTADEILLQFQENQETHLRLNIVTDLQANLGKGDVQRSAARKSIQPAIDGYAAAKAVYAQIPPIAEKYIAMAQALGEASILAGLKKAQSEAVKAMKDCDTAIAKLRAI